MGFQWPRDRRTSSVARVLYCSMHAVADRAPHDRGTSKATPALQVARVTKRSAVPMSQRRSPLPPPNVWRRAAWLALAAPLLIAARHVATPPQLGTIVINGSVRDSMNAIWSRSNQHWNELAGENTLTQMLGAGKPTQREYMGCMQGSISHDTLFVTATMPSHNMRQLQFAVTGDCDSIADFVGAWHTHPYRAAPDGHALKEAGLSKQDLA